MPKNYAVDSRTTPQSRPSDARREHIRAGHHEVMEILREKLLPASRRACCPVCPASLLGKEDPCVRTGQATYPIALQRSYQISVYDK